MKRKETAWGSVVVSLRNTCLEAGRSRKHKTPIRGKDQRKMDHILSKGNYNELVWTFNNNHMHQYHVLQVLCTVHAGTASCMQEEGLHRQHCLQKCECFKQHWKWLTCCVESFATLLLRSLRMLLSIPKPGILKALDFIPSNTVLEVLKELNHGLLQRGST